MKRVFFAMLATGCSLLTFESLSADIPLPEYSGACIYPHSSGTLPSSNGKESDERYCATDKSDDSDEDDDKDDCDEDSNGRNGNGDGKSHKKHHSSSLAHGHSSAAKSSGATTSSNPGNSYRDGAGVRAEGETTAYFGYAAFQTNHFFNEEGDKKKLGSVVYCQTYESYLEYGLTAYDTITGDFLYSTIRETEETPNKFNGWHDFVFGWKRLLFQTQHLNDDITQISFSFDLTVPTGRANHIRVGQFAELLALHYSYDTEICGKGFGFDLTAGYQFYQGPPSDAIHLGTGIRYEFLEDWMIIFSLDMISCVGNGRFDRSDDGDDDDDDADDDAVTVPGLDNYRMLLGNIYLSYDILDTVSATVGVNRILWGRNVGAETEYFAGLTFVF
jgi:hypothetical protein